jgi:hypothetical protein
LFDRITNPDSAAARWVAAIEVRQVEEASLSNRVRARIKGIGTAGWVAPTYNRRFHAFCVGTEKSGTHSVAQVFARHYRSDHEPDYPTLIPRLLAKPSEDDAWMTFLRRRDRRLWLEMEACWLHIFHLERLARAFPTAKFVLTIRDCYSWLDSLVNHLIAFDVGPYWGRAQLAYYRPEQYAFQPGEEAFRDAGLFPIRAYLSAWGRHYRHAVEVIPPERLLVVRTNEIANSAERLGAFLDVDPDSIDVQEGHQAANDRRFHMVERIDPGLLDRTVHDCCADVMDRWFDADWRRRQDSNSGER